MNHIRTYHYYWHIFFFSLLVCMAEFTKAADRDVLERVIYLAKSKGTVYTLLGKVSEQSGSLIVCRQQAGGLAGSLLSICRATRKIRRS